MAITEDVLQYKMGCKPNFSEVEIFGQDLLKDLSSPDSIKELEEILSRLNDETSLSDILFKKKCLFLVWEDLVAYQKPMGNVYKKCIAVCMGMKKSSSSERNSESIMRYMATKFSFLHLGGIPFSNCKSESYNQALVAAAKKYILYPMPEVIGRKILEICVCLCDKNVIKFPIVCICRPKNSRTDMICGSSIGNIKSQVSVHKIGQVKKQEDLPTLSVLKESHLDGLLSASPIETSVFTYYKFLEYEPENLSSLKPILGTSLTIQSEWSNVLAILEPLQPDCKTLVRVQVKSGDPLSGACNLHMELAQIEHYHKCLNGLSVMNNENSPMVLEKMKRFIREEKRSQPVKGLMFLNQIIKEEKSLSLFDKIVMNQRSDLDFTDRLWLLLKDASSVPELDTAFKILYVALEEYTYAPGVYLNNTSTIARDVRRLEDAVSCPRLNASVIFKLMIEIGVEKLRRDYMSIFIGLGILTIDAFEYFYEPDILSEDAVKRLRKLHSILELTIICVKRLTLPKEILSKIISDSLKKYETNRSIDFKAFTFFIPPVKARNLLNPLRPVLWELSLVTGYNGKIKQSIHRFTTTPTRDHIIAPEKYHPKMMLKTASYAHWKGCFVQRNELS